SMGKYEKIIASLLTKSINEKGKYNNKKFILKIKKLIAKYADKAIAPKFKNSILPKAIALLVSIAAPLLFEHFTGAIGPATAIMMSLIGGLAGVPAVTVSIVYRAYLNAIKQGALPNHDMNIYSVSVNELENMVRDRTEEIYGEPFSGTISVVDDIVEQEIDENFLRSALLNIEDQSQLDAKIKLITDEFKANGYWYDSEGEINPKNTANPKFRVFVKSYKKSLSEKISLKNTKYMNNAFYVNGDHRIFITENAAKSNKFALGLVLAHEYGKMEFFKNRSKKGKLNKREIERAESVGERYELEYIFTQNNLVKSVANILRKIAAFTGGLMGNMNIFRNKDINIINGGIESLIKIGDLIAYPFCVENGFNFGPHESHMINETGVIIAGDLEIKVYQAVGSLTDEKGQKINDNGVVVREKDGAPYIILAGNLSNEELRETVMHEYIACLYIEQTGTNEGSAHELLAQPNEKLAQASMNSKEEEKEKAANQANSEANQAAELIANNRLQVKNKFISKEKMDDTVSNLKTGEAIIVAGEKGHEIELDMEETKEQRIVSDSQALMAAGENMDIPVTAVVVVRGMAPGKVADLQKKLNKGLLDNGFGKSDPTRKREILLIAADSFIDSDALSAEIERVTRIAVESMPAEYAKMKNLVTVYSPKDIWKRLSENFTTDSMIGVINDEYDGEPGKGQMVDIMSRYVLTRQLLRVMHLKERLNA
ncbi:MAG: hypothetical protein HQL29_05870, partial [Candidatus Omnitrophica bacterium]|nr:hypothetical protein [Candidatus Omnitrophota bacterium]